MGYAVPGNGDTVVSKTAKASGLMEPMVQPERQTRK